MSFSCSISGRLKFDVSQHKFEELEEKQMPEFVKCEEIRNSLLMLSQQDFVWYLLVERLCQ